MRWIRFTITCGILGPGLMMSGALAAALAYRGKAGESYSLLNHFISELGEVGVSYGATLFNLCLIGGGIVLVGFMLGLGGYLASKLGCLAAAVGVWSGLSCGAVGMVPMNHLAVHMRVADSFFYSGLAAVALFTLAIVMDSRQLLSKWLALPGTMAVVCFSVFLALPHLSGIPHAISLDPTKFVRPRVWALPLLEWSVFASVVIWILSVSLDLAIRRKQPL